MTPPDSAPSAREPEQAWPKEPWTSEHSHDWAVLGIDARVAFDDGSAAGEYSESCSIETRDRIMACVNALRGVSDPAAMLEKVREALQRLIDWDFTMPPTCRVDYESDKTFARAALALLPPIRISGDASDTPAES